MTTKPDMVLDWYFDIPQQKVYCKIDDNLEYIAHEGGSKGYTKIYNGEESFVTSDDWHFKEKYWISENYGELVGYYQPRRLELTHPESGQTIISYTGLDSDGRGLDHMQRRQVLMAGFACAIVFKMKDNLTFVTPDCGKTIYKREPTRDVHEMCLSIGLDMNPTETPGPWPMHPQPCLMHPRSVGVKLSSYDELRSYGINEETIQKCQQGEWEAPKRPDLQKFYIYPS